MHLQHNLIRCALHIDEHITVHITVHIGFSYYVLFKIMASKNHIYIYIYYLPTIKYTYLNLDADVKCVPKKGDWRSVLLCLKSI